MKPSPEEQLLRRLLTQLDVEGTDAPKRFELVWNLLLWIASFGLFLVYFRYGGSVHWTAALLGLVCLAVGFYFAHQTYRLMYARQWPIIAGYLDRDRIEERLRELSGA